jgi:lipoic acid synthetase/lipoyl(octanoyl) transferase
MKAWAVFLDAPLPYAAGVALQERLHAARLADAIPDTVLFMEHTPVVTLGQRGRSEGVRVPPEQLHAQGVELARASRGGNVTFHGPGQCLLYPILRLGAHEADAHGYLHNLEEVALRTAADFGVQAYRRAGMNGAWTDDGKIAAIGFRLKRWVTLHGMSFNVNVDLAGFELIVPCGLAGERVSSLARLLGAQCPSLAQVRDRLAQHFAAVCGRELDIYRAGDPMPGELAALLGAA